MRREVLRATLRFSRRWPDLPFDPRARFTISVALPRGQTTVASSLGLDIPRICTDLLPHSLVLTEMARKYARANHARLN